jgi:hypothetical protein
VANQKLDSEPKPTMRNKVANPIFPILGYVILCFSFFPWYFEFRCQLWLIQKHEAPLLLQVQR